MSSRDSVEANASSGTDFDLPDDILSVMPTDPYDQLDLARKITSMAIASRVTELEYDVGRLRHDLFEKDQLIRELQESLTALNHARREADSRLKIALDDNLKLSKERDQLAAIVKKLSRDLAKLETFKKQLMQSLNDDNPSQAETIDVRTCDQSVPKAYPDKDNDGSSYKEHQSCIGPTEVGKTIDEDSRYAEQRFYTTPHITPRLTPTGTPMGMGTSWTVSSRGYSAPVSPKKTSGITSPKKIPYDGQLSIPSRCSLSQMSSAASSPPRGRSHSGRTPKIDGKEFFRQARSRLSIEQFSAFLANIKEFNAQKQTREETLRKADEIFGLDNKDLYLSFQGLLNRKAH